VIRQEPFVGPIDDDENRVLIAGVVFLVVLLIAIPTSPFHKLIFSAGESEDPHPVIEFNVTEENGIFTLDVVRASHIDRSVEIGYRLYNTTDVVILEGLLEDHINYPFRHPIDGSVYTYITWRNRYHWGNNYYQNITVGDSIRILGVENTTYENLTSLEPGIATKGMRFQLYYTETDYILADVIL